MEAFQLRLWDGRIGRWLSPDPYGQYDSPYLGMGNNPINGTDVDGGWFGDPPTEKGKPGQTYFDPSDNTSFLADQNGNWGSVYSLDNVVIKNNYNPSIFNMGMHDIVNNNFYSWDLPKWNWNWLKITNGNSMWGNGSDASGLSGTTSTSIEADEIPVMSNSAPNGYFSKARTLQQILHGMDDAGDLKDRIEPLVGLIQSNNSEYVKFTLIANTINLYDSTITKHTQTIHLKGHPLKVNSQIDSLNKIYDSRVSTQNAYLKSWKK